MKNCIKCNHNFIFKDRLKTLLNLNGYLKCTQCGAVYKQKANMYRGIYYALVIYTYMMVFSNITLNNFVLECVLQMFLTIITLLLFDLLPHRWHKYTKIS